MKFNDIDMKNWKESDINTDSLWVINERDKNEYICVFFKRIIKC